MRRALLPGCLLGLIANVVACASAPVKPAAPAFDLVKADALVTEGCYDCLTGALDIYTGAVAVPKLRASVLPRLFETTVLLGMREKELALDASKRFDTAKALIAELPATYGAAAYLDMAIAVLPRSGRRAAAEGRRNQAAVASAVRRMADDAAGRRRQCRVPSLSLDQSRLFVRHRVGHTTRAVAECSRGADLALGVDARREDRSARESAHVSPSELPAHR
ncbi:MAG: hypothetical protein WCQ64_04965 [Acidobacteriota bacterium]